MRLLFWWLLPDSNWGHKALQASALPTELKSHALVQIFICYSVYFTRVKPFRQATSAKFCRHYQLDQLAIQIVSSDFVRQISFLAFAMYEY